MYLDRYKDDDSGVGWLLFAMLMLAISVFAFSIAYFAAHIWLVANIALRLMERRWITASWWASVLGVLVYIDWQAWAANAVAN